MEFSTEQQPPQQQRSSKRASVVLRSILPKDHRRSRSQATTSDFANIQYPTRTVPLLPPDHPHASVAGDEQDARMGRSSKKENMPPDKRSKSTVSLRSLGRSKDHDKESEKEKKSRKDRQPAREDRNRHLTSDMKKTKSTTSLRALLTKNRSSKDLGNSSHTPHDKENMSPSNISYEPAQTPIWAQFATTTQESHPAPEQHQNAASVEAEIARYAPQDYSPSKQRHFAEYGQPALQRPRSSGRPKSAISIGSSSFMNALTRQTSGKRPHSSSSSNDGRPSSKGKVAEKRNSIEQCRPRSRDMNERNVSSSSNEMTLPRAGLNVAKRGPRVMAAVAALNGIAKEAGAAKEESTMDPKLVNAEFEAVLDSRNIPENMRQKMRTLTLRVKADFIKQDRGASATVSPVKADSKISLWSDHPSNQEETPKAVELDQDRAIGANLSRPRSKTLTQAKTELSPTKRNRMENRPTSIQIPRSTTANRILVSPLTPTGTSSSRGPRAAIPDEFVAYLHGVRDPKEIEVGRIHKLRLLLRNETVAWVDSFITQGGMGEVVDLLHRIMAIEWREEHEDQLLHETLLCLKGLCTTAVALKRLESMADTLFPSLLGMLFDEEKKGPSEFSTRTIIVNILFAYLNAAFAGSSKDMSARARAVLGYLRGPDKPEEAQPIPFVLEMRQPRPYRVWCNEVSGVSKEVFWIFLHHLNIIPLPKQDSVRTPRAENRDPLDSEQSAPPAPTGSLEASMSTCLAQSYAKRHFPGDRPPVPAAPYIGGVEWDATTYITSHLDLMNGLVASLPSKEERNALRGELKASGFEKVMGMTLRTCKEKFYCGVHSGLQSWVAAAVEDGWDIEYVRYGPTQEEIIAMSPKKSPKKSEPPPKLELQVPDLQLPTLGLGIGGATMMEASSVVVNDDDGWLL